MGSEQRLGTKKLQWRKLLLGSLAFLFSYIIFANIPIASYWVWHAKFSNSKVDGLIASADFANSPLGLMIVNCFVLASSLLCVFALPKFLNLKMQEVFAIRRPKVRFVISAIFISYIMVLIFKALPFPYEDYSEFRTTLSFEVITIISVGIVVPMFEEIYFRGYLYYFVGEANPNGLYLPFSNSLIFALVHIGQSDFYVFLKIFLASLLFSFLRQISGSLLPSIIAHSAFNISLLYL